MSACERCWGAAYTLSRALGGHQVDHYRRLLEERDGSACPAPTTHRPEESPDE